MKTTQSILTVLILLFISIPSLTQITINVTNDNCVARQISNPVCIGNQRYLNQWIASCLNPTV